MTGWVCQWKPFWIPVGDTLQKAYLGEWQRVDDGSICDPREYSLEAVPCVADSRKQRRAENSECARKYEQPWNTSSAPRSSWQAVGAPDVPTWKLSGTEGTFQPSGKNRRHYCLSLYVGVISFSQSRSVPFLNVLRKFKKRCFREEALERKCSQPRCHPKKTLDLLSIPNHVIKKGRPHGQRYGKTPQQKEYHQAHILKKRCIKRSYHGIHDRFLIDSELRAFQLEHDRDEEVCFKMDELEDKTFAHFMMQAEYFRYKQNWCEC